MGACKKIAADVVSGSTSIDQIDEQLFSQRLLTAYVYLMASVSEALGLTCGVSSSGLPDPDIVLRTSGECRISNFLLFQIAYSELIFVDKMWPELTQEDLHQVILEFNHRKRRFGK